MKERTLQILRYLAVPCLLSCLGLNADDKDMSGTNSSGNKGHFVSTYDRLKGQEVTPEAGVVVSGGVDVYILADYIYWHASEGGLSYVYNGGVASGLGLSDNVLSQGTYRHPQFKMSSGFKAGLGLDFHYDGWDMGVTYTWLRSHATDSFGVAPAGATNAALWSIQTVAFPAVSPSTSTVVAAPTSPTSGSADWRLHLNVLDLELGRAFFVSPKMVCRPHFGLKGTWDTQNYTVNYAMVSGSSQYTYSADGTVKLLITNRSETYEIARKQNFWGVGPRAGVNSCWMFSRNFSFFGNWALAALWGQFKNTRTDTANVNNTNGTVVLSDYNTVGARGRTHQLSPVVELELGLRYDYWFCDDEYRFRLGASWENQVWFNQNHFLGAGTDSVFGDLSLQGFTLNVRFDF